MNTRDKLSEIVGGENFSDSPEVLKKYSKEADDTRRFTLIC
jgi:hypothetical protein